MLGAEARDDLDDWLLIWWLSERRAGLAPLGMPRECPSTRGYRSTAIWAADDDSDAHDRAGVARAVGAAVAKLEPQQRSAVHMHARNLAAGAEVWQSARVSQAEALLAAALVSLHRGLGLASAPVLP